MANFSLNVSINGTDRVVTSVGEIEQALKDTRQALKEVAIGGEEFDRLSKQAQNLQREFKNSYKEATNFEMSLADLGESVTRLGSSVAAGFGVVTSTLQLFGVESEDLTEAQRRAQAGLTLALSATTLAANARRLSEDLKNVSEALGLKITEEKIVATEAETVAETANTAATEGNTIATEAQAIATGEATVATRGFTAALLSNPLTALLVGLTAVIGALALFTNAEDKANTKANESNDILDEQLKKLKEQSEFRRSYANLKTELAKLDAKTEAERVKIDLEAAKAEKEKTDVDIARQRLILNLKSQQISANIAIAKSLQTQAQAEANLSNYLLLDTAGLKVKVPVEPEDQKRLDEQQKKLAETQKQLNDLTLKSLEAEKLVKQAEKAFTDFNTKTTTDRVKNFTDYNQALNDFLTKLKSGNADIRREIQDALINDLAKEEDIVGTLIENVRRVQVERERAIQDATDTYNKDLENFRKSAKEKGISNAKVKADEIKLQEQFNSEILLINNKFNQLETQAEKAKSDKIKEIDEILKTEIAFGDGNLYDSKKKAIADAAEFELKTLQDTNERTKALGAISLGIFAKSEQEKLNIILSKANDEQRIRLSKTTETLTKQKNAELELLNIQEQETLRNSQGTEEQKAAQKIAITEEYEQKRAEIEGKYRQEYLNAEVAAAEEIAQKRLDTANKVLQLVQQVSSSLNQINSEYEKLQADRQAGATNDIFDRAQTEIDEQKKLLDAKLINQEEYEAKLKDIQDKAAKEKLKSDEEFAKKAFQRQKALALSNAVVQIAQSILQALGSLPPPFSYISAGISAAAGAVQLALIAKQQYRSQEQSTTGVTLPDIGGAAVETGAAAVTTSSAGGFTGFNQALVGTPTTGAQFTSIAPTTNQRVFVVESDITNTQNKVKTIESNATFG